jgi:hypothetical protein
MSDERMQPLLDAWFRDRDEPARDVGGDIARVMADVPRTRQQGRWWPLPTFDRWVSTFPGRELAPAPIPATNGLQPARGFTMLSAIKFVVASVIVALFGGFLLTGILTTQHGDEMAPAAVSESPEAEVTSEPTEAPTTSARTDILPGVELAVEEVESGVFRVINDGVRDLAKANNTDIAAGYDDGIYLSRPQRFVRLGSDEWHRWDSKNSESGDFEVAPDGTVWTSAIESFDGEEWTQHKAAIVTAVDMTPDGTVWAFWEGPEPEDRPPNIFAYLDEDGWQTLGHLDNVHDLLVAGPDDIWATAGIFPENYLHRFVDGAWQRLVGIEGTEPTWQPAEDPVADDAVQFDWGPGWGVGLGPDGTLWGASSRDFAPYSLVRFDGTEWQEWMVADLVPDYGGGYAQNLTVAPDGSLWSDWWWKGDFGFPVNDGVRHFDGATLSHYLRGHPVRAMDVAADGSLWLLADDDPSDEEEVLDLYVITPEAVAATG